MEGDKRGMEQEEKDMELVSDYLYHRLGDEERLAFEARMAVDEEFRSFYEEIRLMIRGIGSYGRRENLRKVELLESELSAGAPARVRSLKSAKRYYWLAAAAVAVIAVSSVLLTGPGQPDTQSLFENYYEPYPNVFEPTRRGEPTESEVSRRKKAFIAYDNARYGEAAQLFEGLIVDSDKINQDIVSLYLGNCYIELGRTADAIDIFEKIEKESVMRDQAHWYLAMAWIKEGQIDKARKVLEELEKSGGSYSEKSGEILNKIN